RLFVHQTTGISGKAPPPLRASAHIFFGGRNGQPRAEHHRMSTLRDMLDLELALLRRGLDERLAGSERCTCCHRTPLVGERVYVFASGTIACELCRERHREAPLESRIVHGPEF